MNFRGGGASSRRGSALVDLTPLIDVVFQLLIFFLLTSSYVNQQSQAQAKQSNPQVPVELPESSLEADSEGAEDFTVVVGADGEIYVGDDERMDLDGLAHRLARVASLKPETIVLIRGDRTVPYGRIAAVMAVARVSRLKISVVLRDGG